MTRIFTEGFEMGDALFFSSIGGTVVSALPTPFASAYCYKMVGSGYGRIDISPISELYLRERFQFYSSIGSPNYPIFRNSTTNLILVTIDALDHLIVSATTIGTLGDSGVTLVAGRWYYLEIHLKIADAPDGICEVYLDGTKVIDYTGDTQPAAIDTIDNIYWSNGSTGTICIDDIALNDTSNSDGRNDNSWCGPGVVIKITPDGNGTTNDWTGLDGDKINNYLQVDEYPYDSETSYVYASAGSAIQDQYAMSDYTGTNRTILRIWPEVRARKTSTDGTLKIGILPSGGTDDMSDERTITTTYLRYVGDDYKTNPVDAGVWEEADLDAIEAVIEVNSSSSSTSSSSSSSSTTSSSSSTEIP